SSCGRWGCDDRCWFPSLRSGGGTTPHTPRVSAYRRRQWVAPVKEPGPFADRVGSLPTTYHLPPTTSAFRLPIGEHEPIPVACSCSPRSSFPANCPSSRRGILFCHDRQQDILAQTRRHHP